MGGVSTSRASTGNRPYETATLTKDRRIDGKAVACPQCGAEPGDACEGYPHKVRRRMAIRALNQADALKVSPHPVPSARQIHKARIASGLSVRQLAERIGVHRQTIFAAERGSRPTGDAASRLADWFHEATHRHPA